MLLAADIGGTKTLVGLFTSGGARPEPSSVHEYATRDFDSFDDLVGDFLAREGSPRVIAIAAGVAGPVTGLVARLTSAQWVVDLGLVASRLGHRPAILMNDLEAMAESVPVLRPDEMVTLQQGTPAPGGQAVIIAAGTGLGEATLHSVDGRFVPVASEGGHADFSARTPREMALVRYLWDRYGRAEVEAVVSGRGLVNVGRFTHNSDDLAAACPAMAANVPSANLAAALSRNALDHRCRQCEDALGLFVDAYGAEAGNLALRSMATAGVYVGGGIAPKILPALQDGRFLRAFLDKPPLVDLLRAMPVHIILNQSAALLGAAVAAAALVDGD